MSSPLTGFGSNANIGAGGGGSGVTPGPIYITTSRDALASDEGARLINQTVTNITITLLADDATSYFVLEQEASGTITIVGDAGVTIIGSVIATEILGDFLIVERLGVNEYRVRAGTA